VAGGREAAPARSAQPPLVLFACRLNTAASILAEAIMRHFAQGRLRATNAGESAAPRAVNPYAIEWHSRQPSPPSMCAFAGFWPYPLGLLNGRALTQELERIGEAS
jgi:hypothetical protein